MTFSVEVENPEGVINETHSVQVYIDRENLRSLIEDLEELCSGKNGEHLHFFTKSWGPADLSGEAHIEGNKISNHLKICLV